MAADHGALSKTDAKFHQKRKEKEKTEMPFQNVDVVTQAQVPLPWILGLTAVCGAAFLSQPVGIAGVVIVSIIPPNVFTSLLTYPDNTYKVVPF